MVVLPCLSAEPRECVEDTPGSDNTTAMGSGGGTIAEACGDCGSFRPRAREYLSVSETAFAQFQPGRVGTGGSWCSAGERPHLQPVPARHARLARLAEGYVYAVKTGLRCQPPAASPILSHCRCFEKMQIFALPVFQRRILTTRRTHSEYFAPRYQRSNLDLQRLGVPTDAASGFQREVCQMDHQCRLKTCFHGGFGCFRLVCSVLARQSVLEVPRNCAIMI